MTGNSHLTNKEAWAARKFAAHGFDRHTARPLARLYGYITGERERLNGNEQKKWTELGVLHGSKVALDDPRNPVEWIILGLMWDGIVERARVPA